MSLLYPACQTRFLTYPPPILNLYTNIAVYRMVKTARSLMVHRYLQYSGGCSSRARSDFRQVPS
jgi:hypothetical protein